MPERTNLSPMEEALFNYWVKQTGIRDNDHPDSFYDYRGYWKDIASQGKDLTQILSDGFRHYPDTYKQHGHPTFSQESKYSKGPADGGMWLERNEPVHIPREDGQLQKITDMFFPQPKLVSSH